MYLPFTPCALMLLVILKSQHSEKPKGVMLPSLTFTKRLSAAATFNRCQRRHCQRYNRVDL